MARLHRDYNGYINARARTTGHLWQGRFGSVAVDEAESVGLPGKLLERLAKDRKGWS